MEEQFNNLLVNYATYQVALKELICRLRRKFPSLAKEVLAWIGVRIDDRLAQAARTTVVHDGYSERGCGGHGPIFQLFHGQTVTGRSLRRGRTEPVSKL